MAAPAASSACRLLAGYAPLPCDCRLLTRAWPPLQAGNPMKPMVLLKGDSLPIVASSLCQLLQAAYYRRLQSHFLATALLMLPKQQSHDGVCAACTQLTYMCRLQMYMLIFCVVWISCVLLCALVAAPPALDWQALYQKSALHCQPCCNLSYTSCILTVFFCALQAGQWRC